MGRKKKDNKIEPPRYLIQGWFRLDNPAEKEIAEYFQTYMQEQSIDSPKLAIYDAIVALSNFELSPRTINSEISEKTTNSLNLLFGAIRDLTALINSGGLIAANSESQQQVSGLMENLSDLETSAISMFQSYTFEDDEDE